MHPSPAERFYFDQYERQQEAWAWQAEAARLHAVVASQVAGEISRGAAQAAARQGAYVHYEEQTFNIGEVQIGRGIDNRVILTIPGQFGTALSFVATLSNGGRQSGGSWLWWSFHTSVDGLNWLSISSPGGTPFIAVQSKGAGSTRQHGPFGNRLALKIGCKESNRADDTSWLPGEWLDLRLTIGVQRV